MTESESLRPIDVTAPSLEEAINDGLTQLGLTRDDVIIEIIEEGSRGVLGMGARQAVVRLTPLRPPSRARTYSLPPTPPAPAAPPPASEAPLPQPAPTAPSPPPPVDVDDDEIARVGIEVLNELLPHMGVHAEVSAHRAEVATDDEEAPWVLDIRGNDLGILIGRRGETLDALQYITRLIVSRELQGRANIVVDVEGYKSRRETTLHKLALRMAEQAKRLGKTVTLEPMPPNERRIIHIALRNDRTVVTESVGTGSERKVTIIPSKSR